MIAVEAAPSPAAVAAVVTANSAVPGWVTENIPAYFRDRPATVEAFWAAAVSLSRVSGTVLTGFFAAGDTIGVTDWWAFALHYHWFWALITIVFPALRARTAFVKAKTPVA